MKPPGMPPQTSSAFSSTSWLDFFLFSRTGNTVALALVAALVGIAMLLLWTRSRP